MSSSYFSYFSSSPFFPLLSPFLPPYFFLLLLLRQDKLARKAVSSLARYQDESPLATKTVFARSKCPHKFDDKRKERKVVVVSAPSPSSQVVEEGETRGEKEERERERKKRENEREKEDKEGERRKKEREIKRREKRGKGERKAMMSMFYSCNGLEQQAFERTKNDLACFATLLRTVFAAIKTTSYANRRSRKR